MKIICTPRGDRVQLFCVINNEEYNTAVAEAVEIETVAVEEVVVVDGEGNEIEISSVNEDGTITIDLSQKVEEQGNPYERYIDRGSSK